MYMYLPLTIENSALALATHMSIIKYTFFWPQLTILCLTFLPVGVLKSK